MIQEQDVNELKVTLVGFNATVSSDKNKQMLSRNTTSTKDTDSQSLINAKVLRKY
jgi:hypothetical protein